MAELFLASLDSLELRAEQKAAVEGIETDLEKLGDTVKPAHQKLEADLADSAAAGKIDRAKVDADVRAIGAALTANQAGLQDAMNRLHKTLDPEQRKKLVDTIRTRAKEMHERGMGMHGPHGGMGMHGGPAGPGGMGMHGGPAGPGGMGMHGGPPGPGGPPGMGRDTKGAPAGGAAQDPMKPKGTSQPGGGPGMQQGGAGSAAAANAAPGAPAPGSPAPLPGAASGTPNPQGPGAGRAAGPGGHGPGAHGPGAGGPGGHGPDGRGGPGGAGGPRGSGAQAQGGPAAPAIPAPGGPGAHGPDDGNPMLLMLSEELGLTPDQHAKLKTKLDAHFKAQQAVMKNRMAAMEKHLAALATAFESDTFDAKKAGVGAQAPEMVKAMENDRVKFVEIILGVLTAEQRPKFADHIREHAAHEARDEHG